MHQSLDQFAHRISLVLGSGSPSRKQILLRNGIKFETIKARLDEKALGNRSPGADPSQLVRLLASAKADAIVRKMNIEEVSDKTVLLTADQVVVHDGCIMEKPSLVLQAREFIKLYSNNQCSTVGSIALTHIKSNKHILGVDTSTIYFKTIPDHVIDQLVNSGEVMNCAGGLMVEHPLLQPYIDRIEGDQDSVMGLSCTLLLELLSDICANI